MSQNDKLIELLQELKDILDSDTPPQQTDEEVGETMKVTHIVQTHLGKDVDLYLRGAIREVVLRQVIYSYVMAAICVLFTKNKIVLKKQEDSDEKSEK